MRSDSDFWREAELFYAARSQDRSKGCTELGVTIVEHIAASTSRAPIVLRGVAGHLLHPFIVRMSRDSGHVDAPAFQVDEEEHVVGNESSPREHFQSEKVRARQNIHVRRDEIPPRSRSAPLRCRGNAMTAQNVANGLI